MDRFTNKLEIIWINIHQYFANLMIFFIMAYFLITFNELFITFLFGAMEFLSQYLKERFHILVIPIPFIDIGIIISAYYFPIAYVYVSIFLMFVPKLYFGKFKNKYISKAFLWLIFSYFIIPLLRVYGIFFVIPMVLVLRYLTDYAISLIFTGKISFEDFPNRVLCSIFTFVICQCIGGLV